MDEQIAVFTVAAGTFRKELPTFFASSSSFRCRFQLGPGPKNRPLGRLIEPIRVEHGTLVVVAQKDEPGIHHQIDTFARIWPVTYDVPQAIHVANTQALDICQDGLKSLQVSVNVANYRLHAKVSHENGPARGPWE